jgi:hypothetical protein
VSPIPTAGRTGNPAQGNPRNLLRIEGVKMRETYYNLARSAAVAVSAVGITLFGASFGAAPLPAQQTALKAAALESHEGLTISALPWMDAAKYKEKFPKKSPYSGGIVAIQVSFRNDSDDSMRVGLSHIRLTVHLDADNVQELQAISPEELAEAVAKPAKDPTARSRLPLPVPVPTGGGKGKAAELQKEAQNAAVPTGVIAPHSTVEGLLYFDLQNQFDLLQTAHLYVPDVVLMRGNRALTFFDIDLSARGNP